MTYLITTVAVHHVPQQSSHVSARVQPTVFIQRGSAHTNKLFVQDGTRERTVTRAHVGHTTMISSMPCRNNLKPPKNASHHDICCHRG